MFIFSVFFQEESGSEEDDDDDDEDEEEEDDREPVLKYERIGNAVSKLLTKDAASCMAVHSKVHVRRQFEYAVTSSIVHYKSCILIGCSTIARDDERLGK